MPIQDIKKAGVGINGDAQKLMRDFGLQCEGLVDLSEEANMRLCHTSSGRLPEKWSLASEHVQRSCPLECLQNPCMRPKPPLVATHGVQHTSILREK